MNNNYQQPPELQPQPNSVAFPPNYPSPQSYIPENSYAVPDLPQQATPNIPPQLPSEPYVSAPQTENINSLPNPDSHSSYNAAFDTRTLAVEETPVSSTLVTATPPQQKKFFSRFSSKKTKDATDSNDTSTKDTKLIKIWKRRRLIAYLLLVIAALVGGLILGWHGNDLTRAFLSGKSTIAESTEQPQKNTKATDRSMPDLRGMTKDGALTALLDAGFPNDNVDIVEQPWAGDSNIVVEQTPAPGQSDTTKVKLKISAPAKIPDLKGKNRIEAINTIRAMGGEASIKAVFNAQVAPDTVLDVSPKPGENLPATVTLEIASVGASVYLSELQSINGGCSKGNYGISGTTYANSLECYSNTDGNSIEWDIQKKVAALDATIGINDKSRQTDGSVTVAIYADNKKISEETVAFGSSKKISANLEGALRLKIVATGKSGSNSYSSPEVVLGDARLIGTQSNIDQLQR